MTALKLTMEDDGFLPEDTISPFRFFVSGGPLKGGKGLFANDIQLPDLWEVRDIWSYAEIWDEHRICALARYAEPVELRIVKEIDWKRPDDTVYRTDHYDQGGYLYFSDYYNTPDNVECRTWYDRSGREILTYQPATSSYTVYKDGCLTKFLCSDEEYMEYFYSEVQKSGLQLDMR